MFCIDCEFHLNHACLMIFFHFSYCFIVFKDQPLILGVRIGEIFYFSLPVADRIAIIHQIDKDVIHHFDGNVFGLENLLLEAFTPTIIARLRFLGLICLKLKISNFYFYFVLLAIRWQSDTHANLTDYFILFVLKKPACDRLLLYAIIKGLFFALGML